MTEHCEVSRVSSQLYFPIHPSGAAAPGRVPSSSCAASGPPPPPPASSSLTPALAAPGAPALCPPQPPPAGGAPRRCSRNNPGLAAQPPAGMPHHGPAWHARGRARRSTSPRGRGRPARAHPGPCRDPPRAAICPGAPPGLRAPARSPGPRPGPWAPRPPALARRGRLAPPRAAARLASLGPGGAGPPGTPPAPGASPPRAGARVAGAAGG
jgi:hypothetical protein